MTLRLRRQPLSGETDSGGDFFGAFDEWYGGLWPALGQALGTQLPLPPSSGARRFPEGHWRHYAQALAGPFAALTPVAVRLGYPQT